MNFAPNVINLSFISNFEIHLGNFIFIIIMKNLKVENLSHFDKFEKT